ncbi:DNA cytosine methyltransferase [Faecalitalea cylindroides]|uniref:Cytosine-specific methyltransferase n=1 Tax=Faecalitalea cylindroides ATCC 27803 TaxID=649755 RepID=U2PV40_9FIRM|nr:DNA cytosine methyltransferase [Faecalitalea cylindroides]ERK47634.1 DNA (cytosine-5-)-methyltransferase [[Eubacterium] cylindroides ATCC 27803] [Faecalitalea cylindroides ATCC 27803]
MRKYKFIDLFAGCGGLEDGFLQTGFYDCVSSVEWLKPQVDTLRKRLKEKYGVTDADEKVLHFDIQREEELFNGWNNDAQFGSSFGLDYYVEKAKGIDLIIGGPPCQAYSVAGRVRDENGMKDDYRNYLFEHYLSVVKRYRPKAFVFENVPGILSAKPNDKKIIEIIEESFKKNGYIISKHIRKYGIIDASKYGVPQKRKRVILLGVRTDLGDENDLYNIIDTFYEKLLPKYQQKEITVEEAIGDLPEIRPIWDEENRSRNKAYVYDESVDRHIPRYHNLRDMNIYKMLAEDIELGNNKYTNAAAITKIYEKKVGSKSPIHRYHVLRKDEPSTTIIAHLYKDGNRFIHYDSKQARSITPREAARLQSFDDDFKFIGSQGSVFQMIGNAVPPKLAYAIGKAMKEFLDNFEEKRDTNDSLSIYT